MEEHADAGIGATLRDARKAQGRSQQDVASTMRARVAQVQALEDEDFSGFGGEVYVRGFLRSYATEVGVDPGPLLERYGQRYGGNDVLASTLVVGRDIQAPTRGGSPAWVLWVVVTVVALAAIGVLTSLGSGRTPQQASPEDEPSGPPPASVPSDDDQPDDGDDPDGDGEQDDTGEDGEDDGDDGDEPSGDEQDRDSQDEPADDPQRAEVVLALEDASWMRVVIDGALYLEETVPEGETLQFSGEEIEARFGNAGGVYVELNGEELGTQGGRGDVIDVVFTAEGAEIQ